VPPGFPGLAVQPTGGCNSAWFVRGRVSAAGLLFFNARSRPGAAAGWLLFTICLLAITVGYLFGGQKAWCQYSLSRWPPVQRVLLQRPADLLGPASPHQRAVDPQSMCRTVAAGWFRQSACVALPAPCSTVDAERCIGQSHWAQPTAGFDALCYVGLVIGYFPLFLTSMRNWLIFVRGLDPPEVNHSPPLLKVRRLSSVWVSPIHLPRPRGGAPLGAGALHLAWGSGSSLGRKRTRAAPKYKTTNVHSTALPIFPAI